jgi:hypothetical protein
MKIVLLNNNLLCSVDLTVQFMILHIALSDGDYRDSNSMDLFSKHRVLQEVISEDIGTALQALQFIKSLESSFPNTDINSLSYGGDRKVKFFKMENY